MKNKIIIIIIKKNTLHENDQQHQGWKHFLQKHDESDQIIHLVLQWDLLFLHFFKKIN